MDNISQKKLHRFRDPETNPCLKESDLSVRCLEENHYVKEMCSQVFKNYNNCKAYWNDIKKKRQDARIKPAMPGVKERELIKANRDMGKNVITAKVNN